MSLWVNCDINISLFSCCFQVWREESHFGVWYYYGNYVGLTSFYGITEYQQYCYSHVTESIYFGVMQDNLNFVCRILKNMWRSYLPCSTDLVNLSRKLSMMTHDSLQQETRLVEIFVDIKGPLPLVCFQHISGTCSHNIFICVQMLRFCPQYMSLLDFPGTCLLLHVSATCSCYMSPQCVLHTLLSLKHVAAVKTWMNQCTAILE